MKLGGARWEVVSPGTGGDSATPPKAAFLVVRLSDYPTTQSCVWITRVRLNDKDHKANNHATPPRHDTAHVAMRISPLQLCLVLAAACLVSGEQVEEARAG